MIRSRLAILFVVCTSVVAWTGCGSRDSKPAPSPEDPQAKTNDTPKTTDPGDQEPAPVAGNTNFKLETVDPKTGRKKTLAELTAESIARNVNPMGAETPSNTIPAETTSAKPGAISSSNALGMPKQLVGKWSGNLQLDPAIFEKLGLPVPPNINQGRIPFAFDCSPSYVIRLSLGGQPLPYELKPGAENQWTGTAAGDGQGVLGFKTTLDTCQFTLRQRKGPDVNVAPGFLETIRASDQALHFQLRRVNDQVQAIVLTSTGPLPGQAAETSPFRLIGSLSSVD